MTSHRRGALLPSVTLVHPVFFNSNLRLLHRHSIFHCSSAFSITFARAVDVIYRAPQFLSYNYCGCKYNLGNPFESLLFVLFFLWLQRSSTSLHLFFLELDNKDDSMTLIICNKNISFFWQICISSVNSVLIRLPQVSLSRA